MKRYYYLSALLLLFKGKLLLLAILTVFVEAVD